MKILIPEGILSESLDRLRAEKHEVIYNPELVNHHEKLIESAQDIHAIIVRRLTQVHGELLDVMKNCKAVGRLGVGLDNIDVETCMARGIEVIPAIGANARSVAEYVITASMMLMRKAYLATDEVSNGEWPKPRIDQGKEILNSTLGIIGMGSIGRVTADLALKLGVQVIAMRNPTSQEKQPSLDNIKYVPLEELLATSDIVSLHLPYSEKSKNMIDKKSIAQMKSGAIIINAARGGIVNDDALIEALHNGHLGGAAIDVFENEPLQKSAKYSNVPNLILTPHIAGITQQSESRVNKVVIDRILQVLSTK